MRRHILVCLFVCACMIGVADAAPAPPTARTTAPPSSRQPDATQTPKSKAKKPKAKPKSPAASTPKVKKKAKTKLPKAEGDDVEVDRDRYRSPYRYRRYRRYRRLRRYRYRYRRRKKVKQKGPVHRHDRFFWSTEVGYGMFHYTRYIGNIEPPFHFNSFVIGGRWGYASKLFIFTGDIMYGFGGADGLQDGGFMGHLGVTFSYLPFAFLSADFGTGLQMVTSFDFNMLSPALLFPLEVGFTLRFPFKTISLGLRCVGSFSFGGEGVGIGFRALLTLSRT